MVVAKRRGIANAGDQVVMMTVRDLVALLTGVRPQEVAEVEVAEVIPIILDEPPGYSAGISELGYEGDG